jgi:dCTP deaminase
VSAGILSGRSIADAVARGTIRLDPFDVNQINPASYDLRLGEKLSVYAKVVRSDEEYDVLRERWNANLTQVVLYGPSPLGDPLPRDGRHLSGAAFDAGPLDAKVENPVRSYVIGDDGWVLMPGVLYLMHTRETIGSSKYVGVADGKSSLARLGIVCHQTAGYVDPGFVGQITLEVTVVHPVRVYAGMLFCQVRFHEVSGECVQYEGNYVGEHSRGPVASRSFRQFK